MVFFLLKDKFVNKCCVGEGPIGLPFAESSSKVDLVLQFSPAAYYWGEITGVVNLQI
ncbi:hypothetical protein Hanom_Chr12g01120081 [Helianthus anomalus]